MTQDKKPVPSVQPDPALSPEAQLAEARQAWASASDEIAALRRVLAVNVPALQGQAAIEAQARDVAEATAAALRAECEALRTECETLRTAATTVRCDQEGLVAGLQMALAEERARGRAHVEVLATDLDEARARARARMSELEAEVATTTEDRARLDAALDEARSERDALRQVVAALDDELDDAQERARALTADRDRATASEVAARQENEELRQLLTDSIERIEQDDAEIDELRTSLLAHEAQVARLDADNERLADALGHAERRLGDAGPRMSGAEVVTLQGELELARTREEHLIAKLVRTMERADELSAELEQLRGEAAKSDEAAREDIFARIEQRRQTEHLLELAADTHIKDQLEVARLKSQIAERDDALERAAEVRWQNHQLTIEIEALRRSAASYRTKLQTMMQLSGATLEGPKPRAAGALSVTEDVTPEGVTAVDPPARMVVLGLADATGGRARLQLTETTEVRLATAPPWPVTGRSSRPRVARRTGARTAELPRGSRDTLPPPLPSDVASVG